jgi:hypothetical protein
LQGWGDWLYDLLLLDWVDQEDAVGEETAKLAQRAGRIRLRKVGGSRAQREMFAAENMRIMFIIPSDIRYKNTHSGYAAIVPILFIQCCLLPYHGDHDAIR